MKNENGLEKDDILPKKPKKLPGEEVTAKEDLQRRLENVLFKVLTSETLTANCLPEDVVINILDKLSKRELSLLLRMLVGMSPDIRSSSSE